MVAAAVIGGAVIGAGASYLSSSNAADTQSEAAANASAVQQGMYNRTRGDLAPYRQAGENALTQLTAMTSGDPAAIQSMLEQMPGYQFAMTQGLKATQNSFSPRGLGLSGAAMKGAASFATGLADQTFADQWNRLMGTVTMGENAAAQTGAFGTQTASSIGNNLIGAGNAQAAAQIAAGQAVGSVGQSVSNTAMMNYMMQQQGYSGLYSDRRLKTDIERVGTLPNGLHVYRYRFVDGGPLQYGLMADEVAAIAPDAVSEDARGLKLVDYKLATRH